MLKSCTESYRAFAPHHKHPDWTVTKALELIDATFGQETTSFSADSAARAVEMMPLYEDRAQYAPEVWQRRRNMLSAWIENISVTEGQPSF